MLYAALQHVLSAIERGRRNLPALSQGQKYCSSTEKQNQSKVQRRMRGNKNVGDNFTLTAKQTTQSPWSF